MRTEKQAANDFHQHDLKTMAKLLAIKKPEDIKKTFVIDEYEDDHIPSAVASINGIRLDLPWCGSHVVGALDLTDSKKGKKAILYAVKRAITDSIVSEMFAMSDEDLKAAMKKDKEKYDFVIAHLKSLSLTNELRKEFAEGMKGTSADIIDPVLLKLPEAKKK